MKVFDVHTDTWSHPIWDLHMLCCWDQHFPYVCRAFAWPCTSNTPRYFLNFMVKIKTILGFQHMAHTSNISKMCLYIKSDLNFHYSSYLQTSIVIADLVNNRSLQCTYLRTLMYRYVYVTLYVYVMCFIETSLLNILRHNTFWADFFSRI